MKPVTKIVIFVGIYFLILLTTASIQSIFSKIAEEKKNYTIGPFLFICTYTFFMISNLFVPLLNYSSKWLLSICALSIACSFFTNIFIFDFDGFMQYLICTFSGLLSGISVSLMWVNVGTYIHDACHFYNETERKGHYFGLFSFIYSFSVITGAIIITFGLSLMG